MILQPLHRPISLPYNVDKLQKKLAWHQDLIAYLRSIHDQEIMERSRSNSS